MTRWLAYLTLATIIGFTMLVAMTAVSDAEKINPRADALDLLILDDNPARLELRVEIDGKTVPAVWDETFAKMLSFHDLNGDGFLDKTEASRLPSAFVVRQMLWGQFTPYSGPPPPLADLDLNGDAKVSGDELADYYRRAGLGGVLVGVGKPPATEKLTDALLKYLDTNTDGKVDEAEWKAAAQTLRKLDKNDDELIGPGELVEKTIYPGATGAILCSPPSPTGKLDSTIDRLPVIVLPLRTADTHWIAVARARIEKGTNRVIKPDSLATLRQNSPTVAWQARLGQRTNGAAQLQMVGGKAPQNARLHYSTDRLRLELRADEGKLKELTATAQKRLAARFAECDANLDGVLDEQELGMPKAALFKQLVAIADRDSDSKLDKKEFAAWLDLQEQLANGHVLLTVLDHGLGLFEFLDADHDGSISVRELRTAWERLKAAGCITSNGFDRMKLPRQLLLTVSHGHPLTALGKPARSGPAWFLAMDRNGDGDVSRREFTGQADVFDKLDHDKDGFLTAEEASRVRAAK